MICDGCLVIIGMESSLNRVPCCSLNLWPLFSFELSLQVGSNKALTLYLSPLQNLSLCVFFTIFSERNLAQEELLVKFPLVPI
jgi:hypothetical protein